MYNHGAKEVLSFRSSFARLLPKGRKNFLVSEANDNFF